MNAPHPQERPYSVTDKQQKRWSGPAFTVQPEEVLTELNGLRQPERLAELLRTRHRPVSPMRSYSYVGPPELIGIGIPGTRIEFATDLERWLEGSEEARDGLTPATFIVDMERTLRLAPRGSEHVACAGGEAVLAAGELLFDGPAVVEASNQSTGYCPEPASWGVVGEVLDRLGVAHPGRYTAAFRFRHCEHCGELNVVKDGWFVCTACDEALPREWNCA